MTDIRQRAEAEIRRQLFEYALASDTHDWERLGSLFEHGRYHFCDERGADAVREWGTTVIRADARTQHVISTISIDLDEAASPPWARPATT
ncbi:hypothetical protein SHJG_0214 [Streptomyces hygroscopicus subsp. jinggangensis 5008]|nr:hypothetical protein SHJG_0214 [Streptomyces hygroscopicus subsp. jinggangensis 5008]